MASFGAVFVWWLISAVLGVLAFPVAFQVFRNLPDKGYGLSKVLGLLLTSFAAFLLGFAYNSTLTVVLVWGGLAALAWWLFKRDEAAMRAWFEENSGLVFVYEALYLSLLLIWAVVRMKHPHIVDQEKFMDFAFFNAILRDNRLPPMDPWLAGPKHYINYYYYGYFVMASFSRLAGMLGVVPEVAYNLVIAFVFALCGQSVFSLGVNLTRSLWPGALAVLGLQVLGNLHGALQVLQKTGFNWWDPTRLIKDVAKDGKYLNAWWWSASPATLAEHGLGADAARDGLISEFPVFSFIHGDMHPHFTALPFTLLVLGLCLALLKDEDREPLNALKGSWTRKAGLGGLCLSLAALFMANTWDLPAYGLAASLCLLAQQHWHGRLDKAHWLKGWLLPSLALLGGLLLLASPFLLFFRNPAQGFGLHGARTGLRDTLIFWGVFLAAILPFLIARVRAYGLALTGALKAPSRPAHAGASGQASKERKCRKCSAKLRPGKPFCAQCGTRNEVEEQAVEGGVVEAPQAGAAAAAFLKLFASPAQALAHPVVKFAAPVTALLWLALAALWPTAAVFALLLLLSVLLIASRGDSAEGLFVACLVAVASLLVFGVEFFFLRDVFAGNAGLLRMNTVFKFYFQAWVLLSVVLPYAIWWTWRALGPTAKGWAYAGVLGVLAWGGLIYPAKAIAFVWADYDNQAYRTPGMVPTLDGASWLRRDYPGDYAVIQRMRREVEGKPVVLEAVGGAYSHFARVASYTGLPTVVGWGNHESQWRKVWPQQTEADVNEIYNTADIGRAQQLMKQYDVTYVFVGTLERQKYGADALNKFAQFMDIAFQDQGTLVYKRR